MGTSGEGVDDYLQNSSSIDPFRCWAELEAASRKLRMTWVWYRQGQKTKKSLINPDMFLQCVKIMFELCTKWQAGAYHPSVA